MSRCSVEMYSSFMLSAICSASCRMSARPRPKPTCIAAPLARGSAASAWSTGCVHSLGVDAHAVEHRRHDAAFLAGAARSSRCSGSTVDAWLLFGQALRLNDAQPGLSV